MSRTALLIKGECLSGLEINRRLKMQSCTHSFIFREREREGERKGGKHQCVVASYTPPTGDLERNPGMCPD